MSHWVFGNVGGKAPPVGFIGLAVAACLIGTAACRAATVPADSGARPAAGHGELNRLPLNFEANEGQVASREIDYVAHGKSYAIALSDAGAVLTLAPAPNRATSQADRVSLHLLGSHVVRQPSAEQPLPGKVNYFVGNDPAQWRRDVPTYGRVRYSAVYPGVDLVYYGNQGQLEYDFAVAPGASTKSIGIRFDGAEKLSLQPDGGLAIETRGRHIAFEPPVAYQMRGDRRVPVRASYRVAGNSVRFAVGAYDHRRALVIDPVLSYLSYLGGTNTDTVGVQYAGAIASGSSAEGTQSAALDASDDLYVVGYTLSPNFPTQGGLARTAKYQGDSLPWVFVSKVSPDASTLLYSTYIGGTFADYGMAIAVDSGGNAYITGTTFSADFPATAGAFQTVCGPNGNPSEQGNCETVANAGGNNFESSAFVTKLNPTGNQIVYSSFLGTAGTIGASIAVDSTGRAYVAGSSPHTLCAGNPGWYCFPTTPGALQADGRGGDDQAYAFVSVVNASGSALQYSTLFGDKNQIGVNFSAEHAYFDSYGTTVTVDAQGNFYLAGYTKDGNMPTTAGAYQTVTAPLDSNGNSVAVRGFVAKFSPVPATGVSPASTLLYGTYLGGLGVPASSGGGQNVSDLVSGIAIDAAGEAYVYGWTTDNGFPVTAGAYQTTCGLSGSDNCGNTTFIAKLNASGSSLVAATYFGGAANTDGAVASGPIVLDGNGNVYIAGQANYGLVEVNPIQAALPSTCCGFAFAAKLDPTLSKLQFASLLGTGTTSANGLAVDSGGNIYLAGNVGSNGSLTPTAGVFQPQFGGNTGTLDGNYGDGFVAKIANLVIATTTTITATPTAAVSGTSISFTAVVKPATGTGTPTGTVSFKNGATTLGSGTLNGAGQASFSTSSLPVGSASVTAVYGGDSGDTTSTSSAVTVTITAPVVATTTSLVATPISASQGSSVSLTATVAPVSGTTLPTGTVTFKSGTATLGTATLSAGKATFSSTTLPVGAQSITAAYGGDSGDSASTSGAVTVTITVDIPASPTGVKATPGNAQVQLSWTASSGATSYNVYAGTSAGGESKTPTLTGITGTSATVSGLTNGTGYFFTVAAVNAGGTSAPSAEVIASPVAPSTSSGGSHGGGGLGVDTLLGLLALVGLRLQGINIRRPLAAATGATRRR